MKAAAQDFSHIAVDRVGGGLHFAEGPVWSYDGYLLVSDSVVDKIHKLSNSGDVVFAERAGGVMGNAFDTEGRLTRCACIRSGRTPMQCASLSRCDFRYIE